jgi:hypothetical protein
METATDDIIFEIAKKIISTKNDFKHAVCKYMHDLYNFSYTCKQIHAVIYGLLNNTENEQSMQFNKFIIEMLANENTTNHKIYIAAQLGTKCSIEILKNLIKDFKKNPANNAKMFKKILKGKTSIPGKNSNLNSIKFIPVQEDIHNITKRFPKQSRSALNLAYIELETRQPVL